jgi:hypothetical protein
LSAAALAGVMLAAFQVPAAGQEIPEPLLACAAESDDTRRLACFDQALAGLRNPRGEGAATAVPAATAATAATTEATAPAVSAAPTAAPRTVTPEEEFGLRGDIKEEKLGGLSELVATVTSVRAKPHGELVITLANEQVWAELAPGSKIKLKPGDTVKIEAGALRSFILVAPNGRSSKVSRIR